MYEWILPTISEVLAECQNENCDDLKIDRVGVWRKRVKADRQWSGAIAALSDLLAREMTATAAGDREPWDSTDSCGLVLSGPVPILSEPNLLERFSTWTFASQQQQRTAWLPSQLLPTSVDATPTQAPTLLPLIPGDPLTAEQFCLVLTAGFSLVIVKGWDALGLPAFQFSFEPEAIHLVWQALRSRILPFKDENAIATLDRDFEKFEPRTPDYKIVCRFTQKLLEHLPEPLEGDRQTFEEAQIEPKGWRVLSLNAGALPAGEDYSGSEWDSSSTVSTLARSNWSDRSDRTRVEAIAEVSDSQTPSPTNPRLDELRTTGKSVRNQTQAIDVELLQAIAHEVRTPLATIRTLTRLLLKRRSLDPDIIKRLEAIDRECSEQIDRFGLFFWAVELETAHDTKAPVQLTSTSLTEILKSCIPRWQKQASRRNLSLEVILPQKMPSVVSDPNLLDRVLTGAIDNFTSSLAPGSNLRVEVSLAGHQLKVELHSQPEPTADSQACSSSVQTLKSIGQMLMFQPETGNLSLNLSVTKNLFQALGGKLIVRHRPQQGQVLTIFLPLEMRG